ncbi:MAG: hypothetical protein J5744_05390 [Oscillospiraceae bacterium]|nr:hypothetical protein [Oscillospiraceae bacterium]
MKTSAYFRYPDPNSGLLGQIIQFFGQRFASSGQASASFAEQNSMLSFRGGSSVCSEQHFWSGGRT